MPCVVGGARGAGAGKGEALRTVEAVARHGHDALRAPPVAVGWKVTLTLQDVACESDVQVFDVIAKSAALLFVTQETLTVAPPMLVSVSVAERWSSRRPGCRSAIVPDPCSSPGVGAAAAAAAATAGDAGRDADLARVEELGDVAEIAHHVVGRAVGNAAGFHCAA